MRSLRFHHPDFCPKVVARRARLELLEALDLLGQALLTRGRAFTWVSTFPSDDAYRMAVSRLRKRGLIISRSRGAGRPTLSLTPEGESALSDIHRPQRGWNRKWRGIWYVLVYDVPEEDRRYRDTLREFLKRMRMGCLQKSVWISPCDIRPEFSDLEDASRVKRYAVLLEASTVLGMRTDEIVYAAWDMERIQEAQAWFIAACEDLLAEKLHRPLGSEEALALVREELNAYRSVMELDPLLPRELWPPAYAGEGVHELHRAFQSTFARHI